MFKFCFALFLILLTNFDATALKCWQCGGPGGVCNLEHGWNNPEITECDGSCVLDPGKPNPDSISWWIDKKLYCSPEKMESNCDQAVIFKSCFINLKLSLKLMLDIFKLSFSRFLITKLPP